MHHSVGNITGFFAIVVWSLVPLVVTLCAGVPFFPFLSIVCFVTSSIFFVSWKAKGESAVSNLRTPIKILVVVVIGNGVARGLFWAAILSINPVEASLINHLWTMIIVVLGVLMAGTGMRGIHWAGILVGLAGAAVLVSGPDGLMDKLTLGHVMALVSALIWSGYTALARMDERYAGNAVAAGFLTSGLLYLALAVALGSSWDIEPIGYGLIFLAGSAGAAGSYLWDFGRRHGDERTLGKWALLLPLLGTFWLIVFGKSELEANIIIGALLIFAAAAVVSPYARRRKLSKVEEIE